MIGLMDEVMSAQESAGSQAADNELSVAMEPRADCYVGVWAYSLRDAGVFLPGEINEAIDAVEAIRDDRIQETTQGRITPENWTHGSSAQRVEWFTQGFDTGEPSRCYPFSWPGFGVSGTGYDRSAVRRASSPRKDRPR
jgi:predicted metalloprotease